MTGYFIIVLFGLTYLLFPYHSYTLKLLVTTNINLVYKLFIISGFLFFLFTLIDLALFSYRQYAIEQIKSIRQTSDRLNLQLAALKNQLSPHFLFNSLNTASSLIYRNTETAERFVRKLAESYSKILDSVHFDLIPLSKELAIIDTYKFLMEIRYEEALEINISISELLYNTAIPPLSLQLLVENAVKHNLVNTDKPLFITISSEQDEYITVSNNLNDKSYYIHYNNQLIENPEMRSSGIGLKNIQNRYAFFTEKPVVIEKSNDFIVKLPILYRATDSETDLFSNNSIKKEFTL
jgi:LytS/YehU family sensor histidine kinase